MLKIVLFVAVFLLLDDADAQMSEIFNDMKNFMRNSAQYILNKNAATTARIATTFAPKMLNATDFPVLKPTEEEPAEMAPAPTKPTSNENITSIKPSDVTLATTKPTITERTEIELADVIHIEIERTKENSPSSTSSAIISSCTDPQVTKSGVYPMKVGSKTLNISCDADTRGGGWIVILRRMDGSQNFFRKFSDFQRGFGNPHKEYFIGLNALHTLTRGNNMELYVKMRQFNGTEYFAWYTNFVIGDEETGYALEDLGSYIGNASDALQYHKGQAFSTYDMDRDESKGNCADGYEGGWWYRACYESNLMGCYYFEPVKNMQGIRWGSIQESLPFAEMMIRETSLL